METVVGDAPGRRVACPRLLCRLRSRDEDIYMLEAGLRWNVGSAIERLDR